MDRKRKRSVNEDGGCIIFILGFGPFLLLLYRIRNSLKIYFSPVPSDISLCEGLVDTLESECIQYKVNGSDKKYLLEQDSNL